MDLHARWVTFAGRAELYVLETTQTEWRSKEHMMTQGTYTSNETMI